MNRVSEQRMKLRIEYSLEKDLIFSDNIPAYADWLEKKLALSQHDVSGWVAVKDRLPDDDNQVFVRYENGKYGINEWWESDDCWKYKFDNMIVKEWHKPPFH